MLRPLRESHGYSAAKLGVFRRYGGKIADRNVSRSSSGRRSRTRGCCTVTSPSGVCSARLGRWPVRTTPRRPAASTVFARAVTDSSTSASIAVANSCRAPVRSTSVRTPRADCRGNSTSVSVGFVMVAYLLALG